MSAAFLVTLVWFHPTDARSQRENNVWYFGTGAGIDFNGPTPVGLEDGKTKPNEGTASIADRNTGKLLFYSDGISVWNSQHRVMPNGSGLAGHESSTQSALIVPVPESESRYLIFTSDCEPYDFTPNKGVSYSTVDMSLDGGFGDVVEKNIQLLPEASEKLTAVLHANRKDYWVIAHSLGGNTFYVYRVTRDGIVGEPLVSAVGTSHGNPAATEQWTLGYLKASPNGRRLAIASGNVTPLMSLCELFDFDAATGQISNPVTVIRPGEIPPYGVCFSPDNSKLYVSSFSPKQVSQYDLRTNQSDAIRASRVPLPAGPYTPGAIQSGPDGKLYVANSGQSFVGVIGRPNTIGTDCGFDPVGIALSPIVKCRLGLPNIIEPFVPGSAPDADFTADDSLFCGNGCVELTDKSSPNTIDWSWSFPGGSPASATGSVPPRVCYGTPGIYAITLVVTNDFGSDTLVRSVTVDPVPVVNAGPDRVTCPESPVLLEATVSGGTALTYSWAPAIGLSCTDCTNPVAGPTASTTYHLTVRNAEGCESTDSVRVEIRSNIVSRAAISRSFVAAPGSIVATPIQLIDRPASEVRSIRLTIRYDSTVLKPTNLTSGTLALGTMAEGWHLTIVDSAAGRYTVDLVANPSVPGIRESGSVLRPEFMVFLGASDTSELGLEIESIGTPCVDLEPFPGKVSLDMCGARIRPLIFAFDQNLLKPLTPNPVNDVCQLRFSLAFEGRTNVQVVDERGTVVATPVDQMLPAGDHVVAWDATELPPGTYFFTITSGSWNASESFRVVR